MKNEIKEILECMRKCTNLTPDYLDDLDYIEDYITNLEQENKKLNSKIYKLKDESYDTFKRLTQEKEKRDVYIKYLEERTPITSKKIYGDNREELQERIDKAIEYIKERYDYILKSDFLDHDEQVDKRQITYLLNILQGEDKDE